MLSTTRASNFLAPFIPRPHVAIDARWPTRHNSHTLHRQCRRSDAPAHRVTVLGNRNLRVGYHIVAALQGDIETLKSLLPTQANRATPENFTPLSLAVSAGHVEACRLLLREGASPVAQDKSGITALMHACMHGFAELTELLLRHGAKTEMRNAEGQTAASLAARYGRPAGLGVLFRSDSSLVESRDGLGRTPLHWAAVSSHAPTVKYLLGKWKADVGTVDNNQDTPLHLIDAHAAVAGLPYSSTTAPPMPFMTARNAAGNTPAEAAAAGAARDGRAYACQRGGCRRRGSKAS